MSTAIVPVLSEAAKRRCTVEAMTSGLFLDYESVFWLADYMMLMLCDLRVPVRQWMDDLAQAVLFAPLSMRLVGVRNLPTAASSGVCTVLTLEPFSGHAIGIPVHYLVDRRLVTLHRGIMEAVASNATLYSNVRYARMEAELILENFSASRELGELAWPVLLLTMCYYHYVRFIRSMAVRTGLDGSFAYNLVHDGTETLTRLVNAGPHGDVVLRRLGTLKSVPLPTVFSQLARILSVLNGTDLVRMERELQALAAEFGGLCEARDDQ